MQFRDRQHAAVGREADAGGILLLRIARVVVDRAAVEDTRQPAAASEPNEAEAPTAPTPQLPVLFGSRQARSNGRRQAFGAIS